MRNIIEFTGIEHNTRIALESSTILAVVEMVEDSHIEGNSAVIVPAHRLIITDNNQFRVTDSYNQILNKIKECNTNFDLGL